MDTFLQSMKASIINGNATLTKAYFTKAINRGYSIKTLMTELLEPLSYDLENITKGHELSEEEMLLSSRAINIGLKVVLEYAGRLRKKNLGLAMLFCIGTDYRDICNSMNAVSFVLSGFQILDEGSNLDFSNLLEAIEIEQPRVLCITINDSESLMLFDQFMLMLRKNNIRNKLKIFISGSAVTKETAKQCNADFFTKGYNELSLAINDYLKGCIGEYNII